MNRPLMLAMFCLAAVLAAPSTASVQAAERVEYRCVKWKAKHIHDTKKADTIVQTLKKLQCEVKRVAHNGHEDVQYRCETWKTLELKTHEEAHQWEAWLKEYGFETKHEH